MYRQTYFINSLALLCYALFVMVIPNAAVAQTAQQIAKKAFGSTVLLVMEDAHGQPVSLGSGFFVRNGEIASNLHVIEGAARGYAKVVGQKTKYDIAGIIGIDKDRDLVLLRISATRTLSLSLGNSDVVEVGEPVYAVGNPQGLEGTFSQGIVSSIRGVGSDKLLQITAPISPGSSGGPVLNSKGEVIGVSVATFSSGQNLNFAIPSNYLKAMLAKTGTPKPLASAKSQKNKRSIVATFGEQSTEGVIGGQFIWNNEIVVGQIIPMLHGSYTFSLQNKLREGVKHVYALVIFYDSNNTPIDTDIVKYMDIIDPGLAKRVRGKVDASVQRLTTRDGSVTPATRVEIRVLDFQMAKDSMADSVDYFLRDRQGIH